jgi:hypothetical protein
MKELKKRWRLMAFVAVGLLVAALLSLSPIAWATPGQQDNGNQTVVEKDGQVCEPLEADDVVFTFMFLNGGENWTNVEFRDVMDPVLTVNNVTVECNPGPCPADTTLVSVSPVIVTMATSPTVLPADTTVTITIECTCEAHKEIVNIGTVEFDALYVTDYTIPARWTGSVDPCEEEFVPEMGSLLLLGSGLAGLAGYAGVRRRAGRG